MMPRVWRWVGSVSETSGRLSETVMICPSRCDKGADAGNNAEVKMKDQSRYGDLQAGINESEARWHGYGSGTAGLGVMKATGHRQ